MWFVTERTSNPITYSVVEYVQTKGNRLVTHYVAHVADGRDAKYAHLIASAPELLDALQALYEEIDDYEMDAELSTKLQRARQAIAKARGK